MIMIEPTAAEKHTANLPQSTKTEPLNEINIPKINWTTPKKTPKKTKKKHLKKPLLQAVDVIYTVFCTLCSFALIWIFLAVFKS